MSAKKTRTSIKEIKQLMKILNTEYGFDYRIPFPKDRPLTILRYEAYEPQCQPCILRFRTLREAKEHLEAVWRDTVAAEEGERYRRPRKWAVGYLRDELGSGWSVTAVEDEEIGGDHYDGAEILARAKNEKLRRELEVCYDKVYNVLVLHLVQYDENGDVDRFEFVEITDQAPGWVLADLKGE
ncbi:MAG: hypothetical protein ACTSYX_04850 [Candidatus Thorarchaeota archaeon]